MEVRERLAEAELTLASELSDDAVRPDKSDHQREELSAKVHVDDPVTATSAANLMPSRLTSAWSSNS